ncbi:MAG: ParB N-terminal domain-containing protein [Clostridia bacterium]|nr:ParB N-terminal domain-containing protein [Clostridia bacterium]
MRKKRGGAEVDIINVKVGDLIPYENNPRKNDEAVDKVALSISAFGFKVPIVIDKNNVVVTGHTRLKAAQKLGLTEVPCIRADDLTDEQIKAFRLADNKVAEFSTWDEEKLMRELEELGDIDMSLYGFAFPEDEGGGEDEEDDTYTDKTNIPQYDITGEVPDLSELVDEGKTDELVEEIERSSLTFEEKAFLKKAAQRHLVFNYRKVAEYYAAASEEMQELMEKSALVIIDYGDAIANGFTKLSDRIKKMMEADKSA